MRISERNIGTSIVIFCKKGQKSYVIYLQFLIVCCIMILGRKLAKNEEYFME